MRGAAFFQSLLTTFRHFFPISEKCSPLHGTFSCMLIIYKTAIVLLYHYNTEKHNSCRILECKYTSGITHGKQLGFVKPYNIFIIDTAPLHYWSVFFIAFFWMGNKVITLLQQLTIKSPKPNPYWALTFFWRDLCLCVGSFSNYVYRL